MGRHGKEKCAAREWAKLERVAHGLPGHCVNDVKDLYTEMAGRISLGAIRCVDYLDEPTRLSVDSRPVSG